MKTHLVLALQEHKFIQNCISLITEKSVNKEIYVVDTKEYTKQDIENEIEALLSEKLEWLQSEHNFLLLKKRYRIDFDVDKARIQLYIKADKWWEITVKAKGTLENKNQGLVVSNLENKINASSFKQKVFKWFIRKKINEKIGETWEILKKYIADKESKTIKSMYILDGKLTVEFEWGKVVSLEQRKKVLSGLAQLATEQKSSEVSQVLDQWDIPSQEIDPLDRAFDDFKEDNERVKQEMLSMAPNIPIWGSNVEESWNLDFEQILNSTEIDEYSKAGILWFYCWYNWLTTVMKSTDYSDHDGEYTRPWLDLWDSDVLLTESNDTQIFIGVKDKFWRRSHLNVILRWEPDENLIQEIKILLSTFLNDQWKISREIVVNPEIVLNKIQELLKKNKQYQEINSIKIKKIDPQSLFVLINKRVHTKKSTNPMSDILIQQWDRTLDYTFKSINKSKWLKLQCGDKKSNKFITIQKNWHIKYTNLPDVRNIHFSQKIHASSTWDIKDLKPPAGQEQITNSDVSSYVSQPTETQDQNHVENISLTGDLKDKVTKWVQDAYSMLDIHDDSYMTNMTKLGKVKKMLKETFRENKDPRIRKLYSDILMIINDQYHEYSKRYEERADSEISDRVIDTTEEWMSENQIVFQTRFFRREFDKLDTADDNYLVLLKQTHDTWEDQYLSNPSAKYQNETLAILKKVHDEYVEKCTAPKNTAWMLDNDNDIAYTDMWFSAFDTISIDDIDDDVEQMESDMWYLRTLLYNDDLETLLLMVLEKTSIYLQGELPKDEESSFLALARLFNKNSGITTYEDLKEKILDPVTNHLMSDNQTNSRDAYSNQITYAQLVISDLDHAELTSEAHEVIANIFDTLEDDSDWSDLIDL